MAESNAKKTRKVAASMLREYKFLSGYQDDLSVKEF